MKQPKTARRSRFTKLIQTPSQTVGRVVLHSKELNPADFSSNRPLVLGIDPGYGGALGLYDQRNRSLLNVKSMPLTNDSFGKKEISLPELVEHIASYKDQIAFAAMEKVQSMPEQGVASMFNFGMGYGKIRGVLAALGVPTYLVRPQDWKLAMHLVGKDKLWSRNMAMDMFPDQKHEFSRSKDDGKAEAMLIAVYGSLYCGRLISSEKEQGEVKDSSQDASQDAIQDEGHEIFD